jgi:NRAMP (natural resistance-associated macrophage protein)-like metal ion transporter
VPRRSGLVALAAVVGPGILAGLSDDDPAGITTYSILGADYGYELLWVLLLSTVALMLFHELGERMGVATGQGLAGLVRQRFGVKPAALALAALVIANLGTTCAEFAGVGASLELAGVSRYLSVPIAAVGVAVLVTRGGFRRVEHVLLALATVFATYIVAGFLADPDWGDAAHGLLVPSMPGGRDALVAVTAVIGTTLAPWGLAFIQSYAVDKRLTPDRLGYERVDVLVGALMTGIIGAFVVIASAKRRVTLRPRSNRSPARPPPCSSAPGCSAPPCWPPQSSRSRPRTRSARQWATRPRWTTRCATHPSSTEATPSSSRSRPALS